MNDMEKELRATLSALDGDRLLWFCEGVEACQWILESAAGRKGVESFAEECQHRLLELRLSKPNGERLGKQYEPRKEPPSV